MKLSESGEFGLIELISQAIEKERKADQPSWQRLVLSAGDDCAAWRGDTSIQLATTDTMVEGVHFLKGSFKWEDLGHKAMASNLSDIAAMGGAPLYALISLSLPADTNVEDIMSLYAGLISEAQRFGVAIIGGNITRAPMVVITINLLGYLPTDKMLLRSTAVPGDEIAVTGYLGSSAAAVALLKHKIKVKRVIATFLKHAHFHPEPRIDAGQALLRMGVKTAIDVSDGLVSDLTRICEASKVGAHIYAERVPVHPDLQQALGRESTTYALTGGEDFELLFTADPEIVQQVKSALGIPVTIIGEIISEHPAQVSISGRKGEELDPKAKGWDHFQV
jgi:thiamine-monophosphate kinase